MLPLIRFLAIAALLLCHVNRIPADSKPSQIPQLIEALDDSNNRYGASIALANHGKQAVPALRKSLASDKPDRRVWSAYTLGEIGPAAKPAVGDLAKALGSADSALRAAAAQALGKIGPGAATSVSELANLLADEVTEVRQRSAVALGKIGPQASKAAPKLIAALGDSKVRNQARAALMQLGKAAADSLGQSLDDERLRFDVSAILLQVDPKAAKQAGCDKPTLADLPSLRRVLNDLSRSPAERTTAANSLALLGPKGIDILINAFEKESLASTAAAAFARAGSAGAAPLIATLAHEQPGVRAAAADALGHTGAAAGQAIPNLVRLFQDRDHNVRYRAVRALDRFGKKAAPAVPELIKLVHDSKQREPARQWAIMTLVNTLPETHDVVVKALIKASQDKGNYGVSSLARQQVRKIDLKAAEAAGIR